MNAILTIGSIALGIALLYKGSEWLVGSSERLARRMRISRVVTGLTIIAIGTSLPELSASLVAGLSGSPGVALGNVIGSNVANIGLVLGLAVIIRPFKVDLKEQLRDGPWLVLGSVLMLIMAVDGGFSRVDGVVLIVFAILFYWSTVRHVRGTRLAEKELPWQDEFHMRAKDYARNIVLILVGIGALIGGAKLLVDGALNVAGALGLPELLVGLTIVAFGTSLPEIAVTTWSATHGESDIALGNVIGSNISNIFIILGVVALISPISTSFKEITFDLPVMILLTFVALMFIKSKERLSRGEGAILILLYLGYIVWTFLV